MAILSLQNFNTMVQNFASSVQGACKYLIDFSPGSILLSVGEASASVGLWMQWLIIIVLNITRLATSFGTDADSWVGDFSLLRLTFTFATGTVTLSRFTATTQALVLPGAQVKTGDGTQSFIVIADTTQAAWSAALGGYVIASGASSANVTVQAQSVGTLGNVLAGTITLLASAIPFVDSVTNAANFSNGIDQETDAALKLRFTNYIQTRSRATLSAIGYAISSVRQGLNWTIAENISTLGGYMPGNFIVTVDDGSGVPPSDLLTAISLSISAYRPVGSTWTVQAPYIITANISLSILTNPPSVKAGLLSAVQNAIIVYVNALPDGSPLVFSRIAGVAYSVDPSIIAVEGVVLNGGSIDVIPTAFGAVKATAGSVAVT